MSEYAAEVDPFWCKGEAGRTGTPLCEGLELTSLLVRPPREVVRAGEIAGGSGREEIKPGSIISWFS